MKSTRAQSYLLLHRRYGHLNGIKFLIHKYSTKFFMTSNIFQSKLNKGQIIETNGYALSTIPGDKGISSELLLFKTHEPLNTKILKKELKKDMVCLDIGSNIGYYALLESKIVGNNGQVIAIEPYHLNFSFLKENINKNTAGNIQVHNIAISDIDGEVNLFINQCSNLCRVISGTKHSGGPILKVPARSLDSFVNQYNFEKIDFLRMDVEGHEVNIINGGWHTIEKYKPIISIEVHRGVIGLKKTIDLLLRLKNIGYCLKYYLHREIDFPYVGSIKDIKENSIDELIEKLKIGLIPLTFSLLLINCKY